MTLVASALASGDCIDDADVLRARRYGQGAIHPGYLPVQLPVGARASWTGPGPLEPDPGDAPFTIDLDSTICETYH